MLNTLLLPLLGALASTSPFTRDTLPVVTAQPTGATALVQALHAVNDSIVWAVGNNGVVLHTRDGGARWRRLAAPGGDTLQFRDVHAVSADTAWILAIGEGALSRIYHTTNGGTAWTLQFINPDPAAFYDCLSFGTRQQAVVFGDASGRRTNLLRTDDGGRSWRLLAPGSVPEALPGEGAFAASGQCVVHGDANTVYVATGAPGARLFRSRDAGRSWSTENTPFVKGTAAGLTGLAFSSATRGLAVGANIDQLRTDSSANVVGYTADGGRTWEMRPRPPLPGAIAGVAWVPGASRETAIVSSYCGASWTPDAGKSWRPLHTEVTAGITSYGRHAWLGGRGYIYRIDWP
jgi:photosystem II stability/assembly factor-like uncharacterized protein